MLITAKRIAKHASRLLEHWRSERKLLLRAAVDALSVAVSATVSLLVTAAKNNTVKVQQDACNGECDKGRLPGLGPSITSGYDGLLAA